MLMASVYEGTPMCALESYCLGVPIVTTNTDLAEIVVQGKTGFVYETDEQAVNYLEEIVKNTDNINAIKEASGNISNITEIKALLKDKIDIYSGNDDQIIPILSIGGIGVISVLANIMPKETHEMVIEYLNGNIEKAREIQLKTLKLIKALFIEKNPIPVKKALELMGMINGTLREPLIDLEEKHVKELKLEMKNNGIKILGKN